MSTNIAPDYCGQKQPHAAHEWHTPPIYGAATIVTNHQCAGLSVAVEPGPCWDDSGIELLGEHIRGETYRCELRAGHLGAHECQRGHGSAVWPASPTPNADESGARG